MLCKNLGYQIRLQSLFKKNLFILDTQTLHS